MHFPSWFMKSMQFFGNHGELHQGQLLWWTIGPTAARKNKLSLVAPLKGGCRARWDQGVTRAFLLGQSAKLLFFLLSSLLPLSWSFLSVSVFALGMLLSFFILLQLLSISMVIHPPWVVAVGIVAVAGMLFTTCCTLLFVRGNTNHNHCRKETTQKHEAWNIYRHVKFVWYHVRLINPDVTMLVGKLRGCNNVAQVSWTPWGTFWATSILPREWTSACTVGAAGNSGCIIEVAGLIAAV